MTLIPHCPLCGMPCEVDYETGLITECLGCEAGIGRVATFKEDDWDLMEE